MTESAESPTPASADELVDPESLDAFLAALTDVGITHVVGIPDNTSGVLFHALRAHPSIRGIIATREGEAFALASGLWLGGAFPLVVVQNTGFLESGDALRGTAVRMGVPLPVMVTGRGYAKMTAAGLGPDAPRTRALLVRPDVDSVALFTEPTLDAWGIPFETCGDADDPAAGVRRVVERARSEERPVALLLVRALQGRS
ncbi:MAG: thiamine pyrophosphate-binding protein [Gemmatimonadota bacterium]|jgi:hypothetical protein